MGALSKGCISCKKKKVKCDEVRPTCTRCRNAGIECTGSLPRLRFVDERPRIRRSMAASHAQSREFSVITTGSTHLAFHSSRIRPSQPRDLGQGLTTPFLAHTRELPLTAFKDDIFISYLRSKFFEGEHHYPFSEDGEACVLPTEWIPELIKTPQQQARKSWDALAAIAFGKAHRSCDIVKNAFELYGQALMELRNKIASPDEWRTDNMLASMTALYIYEMLAWKIEKGWMLHANGLGWLLEWRGPRQQKSSIGKSIFLEHRIMLVTKSIISRQSTFLRDPIWKTVPWEDDPKSKLAIDYLVDIGADIAEYLAQIKALDSSTNSDREDGYSQVRTQVASSLKELNTWWLQWEVENAHSATETTSHQTSCSNPPLFPTHLEYDSLWTAFTINVYDAMRILLLQLWEHMVQLSPHSIPQACSSQNIILDIRNRTALLGITSDTKGLACEIMRSLTYCYRKTRRFVTTFSFLFIQDVAYGCFEPGSNEALWAVGHKWAELAKADDVGDANLLKRLVPLGQINAGNLIKGGCKVPRV